MEKYQVHFDTKLYGRPAELPEPLLQALDQLGDVNVTLYNAKRGCFGVSMPSDRVVPLQNLEGILSVQVDAKYERS